MKITVFGDVHGNLIALEKMFKIEKSQTDLFISHGDVLNYGPWSNECVQFLNEFENINLLKGNHEDYFIKKEYDGKNEIAQSFFKYCIAHFDEKLTPIIKKYQAKIELDQYTIQHTIFDQYIFEDTNLSDFQINNNFIIGHSHQQYQRELTGFKILNTGSLGQNRSIINQSCYLCINTETNKIEFKTFEHEINKLINEMKSRKYPQICIDYYLSKKQI